MLLYEFGPFRLDAERLLLHHDGAPVALGPKVVETLLALVEHAGEMISKRELLARIWPEGYVDEASLSQNVYVLRKLFRGTACEGAIETVPRRGYRFGATVQRNACERSVRKRSFMRPAAAVALALLACAIGAGSYALSREPQALPMSAEARLFTIGSFYLSVRTRFAVERSIIFFTRAIANTGGQARDYAGLAESYELMADYRYGNATPGRDRRLAVEDAHRALALDPRCGHAYAVLGLVALDVQGRSALGTLSTATSLAPDDADAREWYAIALLGAGHVDAAQEQLEVAQRLDPLSIAAISWMASTAYLSRHYDDAVDYAREGLAVAPWRNGLWITLGLAQEAQGRTGDAAGSFRRYASSCAACGAEAAALLAYLDAKSGNLVAAREELLVARHGLPRPEDLALALAAAGEQLSGLGRLPGTLTEADRVLVANDPRFGRLPSSELRRLDGQG